MLEISIVNHKLIDFAGFNGKHSIKFHPNKPNLILGINGSGKSSLLNSIYGSIMLMIGHVVSQKFNEIDITASCINLGKESCQSFTNFEIIDGNEKKQYEIGFSVNLAGNVSVTGKDVNESIRKFKKNVSEINIPIPVFRYFQSEKLIQKAKTIVSSQSFNKIDNRYIGSNSHSSVNISIQEVTSFFINQVNIENQQKIDKKDFSYETLRGKYIRKTINTFSQILYGENLAITVASSKYSNGQSLIIEKAEQSIEFMQLSSGEKYVISLALELIYRNILLNPNSKEYEKTPGIILIDEIDDHLHPRWQLTILKALTKSFPNFQFIVSSHSPLIASSVRNDQIIALSNFEVIPSNQLPDIYSGSADELLRKILFSNIQIDDFINERNEINKLISKFEYEKADNLLAQLKEKVRSSPKWIRDYERKISFAKR